MFDSLKTYWLSLFNCLSPPIYAFMCSVADAKKKLASVDEGHRSLEVELEREAEQLREEKLSLLQEVEVVRHQLGEEKRVRADLQQRMGKEVRWAGQKGGEGRKCWHERWAG